MLSTDGEGQLWSLVWCLESGWGPTGELLGLLGVESHAHHHMCQWPDSI